MVSKITFLLMTWSRDRPEWIVSSGDPGTKLAEGPDVLRSPDVGVTRSARAWSAATPSWTAPTCASGYASRCADIFTR